MVFLLWYLARHLLAKEYFVRSPRLFCEMQIPILVGWFAWQLVLLFLDT